MTAQEFTGPFQMLCRGLECQPTAEQLSAWFRRTGHITLQVWKNVVDTLLFDGRKGYLPKLDHVLEVVEKETEWIRKATVERDKFEAKRTYTLLKRGIDLNEDEGAAKTGTPLFACIRAFSERKWLQGKLSVANPQTLLPDRRAIEIRIAELTNEINKLAADLDDRDAARLVQEYEQV